MGGIPWSYRVPYQPDIEQALRDLKQEVFEDGDYSRPTLGYAFQNMEELGAFDMDDAGREAVLAEHELAMLHEPLLQMGARELRERAHALNTAPQIESLEALLLLSSLSDEGTSSILDMEIADKPGSLYITPRTPSELIQFYGTDRPTYEMARRNDGLYENLDRGEGAYFIVYKNDEPSEIIFAGWTVD